MKLADAQCVMAVRCWFDHKVRNYGPGCMNSHSNPNPTEYSKTLTPSLAVILTIGVTQPLALILLVRGIACFTKKLTLKMYTL